MKKISKEQISQILGVIYQTNITAQMFDAIRKLLEELPEAEIKNDKGGEQK